MHLQSGSNTTVTMVAVQLCGPLEFYSMEWFVGMFHLNRMKKSCRHLFISVHGFHMVCSVATWYLCSVYFY